MILAATSNPADKLVWIGLIILGFIFWWPLGLAILAYLIWSGKMKCWHSDSSNNPRHHGFQAFLHILGSRCCDRRSSTSSGNTVFDEYRDETLRRLEEDQREFAEFLDRLRRARDRTEFDQFMAERKQRRENPDQPAKD